MVQQQKRPSDHPPIIEPSAVIVKRAAVHRPCSIRAWSVRENGEKGPGSTLNASLATSEPCELHANGQMQTEGLQKWLVYLIAMGRPDSGLKRHIQAHCQSTKKTPISI